MEAEDQTKIETQSCNASEKAESKMKAKIFKQISNYDIPFNEKIWGVNLLIIISNVHVHFEYTNETHSFCTTGPPYREIFTDGSAYAKLYDDRAILYNQSDTCEWKHAFRLKYMYFSDHRLGFC